MNMKILALVTGLAALAAFTIPAPAQAATSGWITQRMTWNQNGNAFTALLAADADTLMVVASPLNGYGDSGPVFFTRSANGTWGDSQYIPFDPGADGCNDIPEGRIGVHGDTAVLQLQSPRLCDPGSVAVFHRDQASGKWSIAQIIQSPDGSSWLGAGLAFDGVNLVMSSSNALRVYHQQNGTWTQVQALTDCNGVSISISGDYISVGQVGETPTSSGYVWICHQDASGWTLVQTLTPTDGATYFGFKTAIGGDTAAVYSQLSGGGDEATLIYTNNNGVWTNTQTIPGYASALEISGDRLLIGRGDLGLTVNRPTDLYTRQGAGGQWDLTQSFTDNWQNPYGGGYACFGCYIVAFSGQSLVISAQAENAIYTYSPTTLALDLTGGGSVKQGAQFTLQAIATNDATSASPAITIDVPTPANAQMISATAVSGGSCTTKSSGATCVFGPIATGGTATANIVLQASGKAGASINTVASVEGAIPAIDASAQTLIASSGGGGGGGSSGGGGGGAFGIQTLALLFVFVFGLGFTASQRKQRGWKI